MIKISNESNTILETAGKILDVVPKLYEDVVQPTAIETGKTLSLIPKTVNAALVPLRKWIILKESNFSQTEILIAEKLKNTAPEKIVEPEPYVAIPALQAISYSMDNEELRNLYANLLAKSMNMDIKDEVHPAFVEIIKQLSPLDARLLKKFIDKNYSTYAILTSRLYNSNVNNCGFNYMEHIINPEFGMNMSNFNEYKVSLLNLERLGLINIDYDNNIIYDYMYEEIMCGDIINHCKNDAVSMYEDYSDLKFIKGSLNITHFGAVFGNICIKE